LGHPDERSGRRADPMGVERTNAHGQSTVRERLREPRVVGHLQRAFDPHQVAAHRLGRIVVAAHPRRLSDRSRTPRPRHAADVDKGMPAVRAGFRVFPERAGDGDGPWGEPTQQRAVDPRLAQPTPADPAQGHAAGERDDDRSGASPPLERRRGDRCEGGVRRHSEAGAFDRIDASPPGGHGAGDRERCDARDQPPPPWPRGRRGRADVPGQEPRPEHRGRDGCPPALHRSVTP
jgi:hypothetical protein